MVGGGPPAGARVERERAMLAAAQLEVRREAGLAWLDKLETQTSHIITARVQSTEPSGDKPRDKFARLLLRVETLDEQGVLDETYIVFTSDNGCAPYIDVAGLEAMGHFPSGPLRGYKADAWEGGHRVPFIVSWPAAIPAGTVRHQIIGAHDTGPYRIYPLPVPPLRERGRDVLLLRAGVVWPASCRNGSCRVCIGRLVRGRVRYAIEWPGLLPEEKAAGNVLPCAAFPLEDLVLSGPGA